LKIARGGASPSPRPHCAFVASPFHRKEITREERETMRELRIGGGTIRNSDRVFRSRPNDHAGEHENILIAKVRDSESTHGAVNYIARLMRTQRAQQIHCA
jgi:hypothetical protein